jgi:hypothetical protein
MVWVDEDLVHWSLAVARCHRMARFVEVREVPLNGNIFAMD